MTGAHGLYVPAHSALHRLRPQCKLVATVAFVLAVVATPRESFWAFGVFAVGLAVLARVGRLPLGFVVRRLAIEAPFLAFALFLPLVGQGRRIDVLGASLSVAGLWGAWNIVVKGTLGVAATIVLAATTPIPAILRGMERLRVPRAFTTIAAFMVRYLDVVVGEMRRMKIARESRGYDPRWLWQARALAASAGTLFVRCYERGERVHVAMLSRGYTGAMPLDERDDATTREWMLSLALPAGALLIAAASWARAS